MAEQIAFDEWLVVDGYDISGVSSNFGTAREVDLQEFTCFPDPEVVSASAPYRKRLPGAESAMVSVAGYLDPLVNLAAANAAFALSPVVSKGAGRALGSEVLMFVGKEGTMMYGGEVGAVIPLSADINSDGMVVAGKLFEFGAVTATGNGTSRTVSAVTTGKVRVLHVHVVAASGTSTPTITLIYETSALGDYSDAVTRHTFAAFTDADVAAGTAYERAVKTAAVSDTNGRFRWTITGTDPRFLIRLSEGVR